MIHEWTPTRIFPGNSPTILSDTLCPTCRTHQETPAHIYQCTHPSWNKIYQNLQLKLTQLFTKLNIDPNLYQMYWLGIQNTLADQSQHTIDMYPNSLHSIFNGQTKIGWQQLHYG